MSEFNININPQQGQIPDLFQKLEDNGKKLDIIDAPIDFSQGNNKEVLGKEPISPLDGLESKVNLDELDEFAKEFLEIKQKREEDLDMKEVIEGLKNGTLKFIDPGSYAQKPEGSGEKVTEKNIDDVAKEYGISKKELDEAMKNGSVEVDGDKVYIRDENGRVTTCYDYNEDKNERSCYNYYYNEDGSYTMTQINQDFLGFSATGNPETDHDYPIWASEMNYICPRGYDKDGNFDGTSPDDPNIKIIMY